MIHKTDYYHIEILDNPGADQVPNMGAVLANAPKEVIELCKEGWARLWL